jgi:hypothetical protein
MVTRKWEWVARERNKQLPLTRQISFLVTCTCLKTASLSIGTPFPVAYKPIREPARRLQSLNVKTINKLKLIVYIQARVIRPGGFYTWLCIS